MRFLEKLVRGQERIAQAVAFVGVDLALAHRGVDKGACASPRSGRHPRLKVAQRVHDLIFDAAGAGGAEITAHLQHGHQRFGQRVEMRGKLKYSLPGCQCIGLVAGSLMRLGLAQPCHEIAPIDVECGV